MGDLESNTVLKRITYLEKREDLSQTDFGQHWAGPHAEIARDLPGVACYLQNHVQRRISLSDEPAYRVDGIVELWFVSHEVVSAASDSLVADRLVEDEVKFLSGLTGGPVIAHLPHDPWPYKIWVLGLRNLETTSDALGQWEQKLCGSLPGVLGSEINLLKDNPVLLLREGLRHETRIPHVAVALGFEDQHSAENALDVIAVDKHKLLGLLRNVHVYLAHERVIVDPK